MPWSKDTWAGILFVGLAPLREDADDAAREPFTRAEVAALIRSAEGDWRGLVTLAATTACGSWTP
jgi:hypothetical protein